MNLTTAASTPAIQTGLIDLDTFSDLMEEGELVSSLDIGATVMHRVTHPVHGSIMLVSSTEACAFIQL